MSGYISSALLFGRMVTAYPWGRVSDIYGRLPVAYVGNVYDDTSHIIKTD